MVLYLICPKCGYERKPHEKASEESCPGCGLIFAKYVKKKTAVPGFSPSAIDTEVEDDTSLAGRAKALLLHVPSEVDPAAIYMRAALFAALVIYGVRLAAMDIPSWEMSSALIHLPMVPIHEFGHVLFMPFGEFLMLLGGSLFQVTLPLIFAGIFLLKNRDPFAASVMLWWSAVAVMDVAPYMYDAAQPQHVLLTGRTGDTGAHDFIDVLYDLGLLKQARAVGYVAHAFGVAMLVAAFAWGAYILYRQCQNRGA
jgi:hypothetical protein